MKFISNLENTVEQRPPKSTARPHAYYMSRKRRIAKGLIVGTKTIRGGRGEARKNHGNPLSG